MVGEYLGGVAGEQPAVEADWIVGARLVMPASASGLQLEMHAFVASAVVKMHCQLTSAAPGWPEKQDLMECWGFPGHPPQWLSQAVQGCSAGPLNCGGSQPAVILCHS